MSTKTDIKPLSETPGAPADHRITLAQITRGILMSCGARDFVHDDKNGTLMFSVGPKGRVVRKVIVKLLPSDTYAVEYGKVSMSNPYSPKFGVWEVVEQELDVPAEALAATVRRLGDRDRY